MSRKRQREDTRRQSRLRLGIAVLGVSLVAVMAVGALIFLNRPSRTPPLVKPEPPPFASGTSKGSPDAPVTIIEYSDFQ